MQQLSLRDGVDKLQTSADLVKWLAHWPSVASQLKLICEALRRKQLHGAHVCAKAALELLRTMVGTCKFHSTYHLIHAVRAVAKEVQAAAPSEFTIGNIARRVLFMVREEYGNTRTRTTVEQGKVSLANVPPPVPLARTHSGSSGGVSGGGSGAPHSPASADLLSRRLSMSSLALPSLERSTSSGSVASAAAGDVISSPAKPAAVVAVSVTEVISVTEEAEDAFFNGSFTDIKQVRATASMTTILVIHDAYHSRHSVSLTSFTTRITHVIHNAYYSHHSQRVSLTSFT